MADKIDWTSIWVKRYTHKFLNDMRQFKAPGKVESFDDVIRRGMNIPDDKEEKE